MRNIAVGTCLNRSSHHTNKTQNQNSITLSYITYDHLTHEVQTQISTPIPYGRTRRHDYFTLRFHGRPNHAASLAQPTCHVEYNIEEDSLANHHHLRRRQTKTDFETPCMVMLAWRRRDLID